MSLDGLRRAEHARTDLVTQEYTGREIDERLAVADDRGARGIEEWICDAEAIRRRLGQNELPCRPDAGTRSKETFTARGNPEAGSDQVVGELRGDLRRS
jgi:hypothetical protein